LRAKAAKMGREEICSIVAVAVVVVVKMAIIETRICQSSL